MKSILVLLLLFSFSEIIACTCETIPKIDREAIDKAKDIFIGKVIKVESNDNRSRRVAFKIIERFKTIDTIDISIFTGLGGADCGLNIQEGQEWYIFTYNDNGKSWAGLCGRSALLSEHSISNSSKKFYRKAVRQYKKEEKRAQKEIRYILKNKL